jgi:hypothetical protein
VIEAAGKKEQLSMQQSLDELAGANFLAVQILVSLAV